MTDDTKRYYWIAINGSGCAMSSMPLRNAVTVPVSEQMFGFPTLEEAKEAQRICLYEPMERVAQLYRDLLPDVNSGRVVYKRSKHADPQTHGTTAWMEAPVTPDDAEFNQIVREAWVKSQEEILPGLPGGSPLKPTPRH